MYCTNCGHQNPEGAHFCANCGTLLQEDTTMSFMPQEVEEQPSEGLHPERRDLESGQGLLIVQRGPNAGSSYLLDRDVTTIGRMPDSDIFLDDVTVSRRHAEVRREVGSRFFVQDVGSLNGTYVNLQRVERAELANEDEVQVGRFKLAFYVGE